MHKTEDGDVTGGQDGRPEGTARPDDDAHPDAVARPDAVAHSDDARPGGPAGPGSPNDPADAAADPASGPTLTVAAVAGRLGVAPATLRTWDRRYGLGPSEHTAGAHRRYSAADLARLMTMRSLTLDGVPPSDAARVARESAPVQPAPVSDVAAVRHLTAVPDMVDGSGGSGGDARPADAAGQGPAARPQHPATPTAVIDAALRADAAEVTRLLALPPDGDLARWWSDLVGPARAGIAARTVLARPGDEPDALVVAAALAVLRARNGHVPTHPSRRRIVLMLAAPGEPRPLSLHVLAGALADSGVDARVVAGPTGRHRLLEIATMTTPSAVVMSSELTAPDLGLVAALAEQHPELPVFVMVPDEAAATVPLGTQVHRVRTVPGLVHEVLAVCG
ncbi:MerR family transcriptional regulator [Cellulomonas endometrii]|uniref:MerR family transcriptional regulator n=1 Tax=Cellulomonas endometrii TaxID=3036301 RepID=UPI0024AD9800|nr:MerR family transcriptional regulator [Cellulomonas endometrii]